MFVKIASGIATKFVRTPPQIVRLAEALSPTKYPMSTRRPQKETARFRFVARQARFRWTDGGYGNAAASTGEVVGAIKFAAPLEPFAEGIAFIE